jgi:hypothetical protein
VWPRDAFDRVSSLVDCEAATSLIATMSRLRLLHEFAFEIEQNDSAFIKSMLERREVDVNARLPRDNNRTAFIHAAWLGRDDIVEQLLNAGAQIDDVDDVGQSACHVAAENGHVGTCFWRTGPISL